LRSKRKFDRFIRRLETEFSVGDKQYRAISSDFSVGGLFVRTNHAFEPETIIVLTVYLPDGSISKLKGMVRRAYKTPGVAMKNGMGVELIEKDECYLNFIRSFSGKYDPEKKPETCQDQTTQKASESPAASASDFLIIACPNCGVKNKVSRERLNSVVRCGKCSTPLQTAAV
jgi:ribosomal protein S27E/Tfp pilus assembly protein PilZ